MVIKNLSRVPQQAHTAILLRHAAREQFSPGSFGNETNLTPAGVQAAEALGRKLRSRRPGRLMSSPLQRCISTVEALARSAGWDIPVELDDRLGAPGPFVVDADIAGPLFQQYPLVEIVQRQLMIPTPLPGMRSTSIGVALVIDLMLERLNVPGRLDVLVTHDIILAVVVGYLLETIFDETMMPDFLEGLIIWKKSTGLGAIWRHQAYDIPWPLHRDNDGLRL